MTALRRRLQRLEQSVPQADSWARMDEIVAGLSDEELRTLVNVSNRFKTGQPATPEQERVWKMLEGRFLAAGIAW